MIIPNTKTLLFFFYFQIDWYEEILNDFGIKNYLIFHLIFNNCCGFVYFNRPPYLLTLTLIVTTHEASEMQLIGRTAFRTNFHQKSYVQKI